VSKRYGALADAWGLRGAGLALAMAGASACNGPSTIPPEGWTEPLSIWSFHPRSYFGIYDLDLAVSADDRAFASWSYVNETDEAVFVAVREPGGGWSPAQRLDHSSPVAQTQPGAPDIVGIDPGGGALIVWRERASDGSRAFWSSRHDGRSSSAPAPIATLSSEDTGQAAAMGWARGGDRHLGGWIGHAGRGLCAWARVGGARPGRSGHARRVRRGALGGHARLRRLDRVDDPICGAGDDGERSRVFGGDPPAGRDLAPSGDAGKRFRVRRQSDLRREWIGDRGLGRGGDDRLVSRPRERVRRTGLGQRARRPRLAAVTGPLIKGRRRVDSRR
jgi:hypothetical protein